MGVDMSWQMLLPIINWHMLCQNVTDVIPPVADVIATGIVVRCYAKIVTDRIAM